MPVRFAPTDRHLTARVTVLTGSANGKYPDGNSVLVCGSEGTVLIDPSLTVHERGGAPVAVDHVLVSHAHEDHIAGIGAVGAKAIHAHHDDLGGVHDVDRLLMMYGIDGAEGAKWRDELVTTFHHQGWPQAAPFADGDVFDLGGVTITVMHLPGHTRGHSAFVIEPDGVAFVGDIDLSSFGPYYGDHWSDLDDFVDSIDRVRTVEAAQYVTFHHKGVVTGRDEFLRQLDVFASVIGQRDDRLLALLRTPKTLADLAATGIVYRPGARPAMFGDYVEHRSIEMHLERLVGNGTVSFGAGVYSLR